MGHLPDFISDLALILITASIATIVFKWLKQPVVLGYIVAGLLAGPHISWLPTVTDMNNVTVWSEIGVIFLLFALGLEFSFKKLMNVGGTASIATLINMASMIIIGYIVGQLLGYSSMNSLFIGGMLSMSSTTIIIKAFNDMNLQKKKFAGIVFGMLIVEDLAAILMMVLLTTLAVSQTFHGEQMGYEILKLGFFVLIWFVVGIYLVPTMLKKLKKYLNDETLLIVSVGMCLGMVLFASHIGFSAALGAFIMGSILAETIEAKHIEHLVEPLKNLFGAVFFVSVGMMLAPEVLVNYADRIIIFTIIVLIGRVIFATLGVMASGQGLKVSIQAGFSLAQIGEFSFIIATVGITSGVLDNDLYPIIVAVSVITTFTTPYFIKGSEPFYNWLIKKIPANKETLIKGYAATRYNTVDEKNNWNDLIKKILSTVAIYSCICIAIIFLFRLYAIPFISENIVGVWGKILGATIVLLCMAPFLRPIIMKINGSELSRNIWNANRYNKVILIAITIVRISICCIFIMMILRPLFPDMELLLLVITFAFLIILVYLQGIKKQSYKMETRFMENLNSKEMMEEKAKTITSKVANKLLSKEIHIEEFEIPQNSPIVGKTLKELNFKQRTGVNIISIIRGSRKINIPDGNEHLYPFDRAIVAGSDEEIQQFIQSLEEKNKANKKINEEEIPQHHINLSQYIIEPGSPMIGKSILELGIREKTECMVIGIDRNGESIIDFKPNMKFEEGDIVWLAGEKNKLFSFTNNIENKKS